MNRFRAHPVMEQMSMDYQPDCSYRVKQLPKVSTEGSKVVIEHNLSGDSFVYRQIMEGKAVFVCTVVSAHAAWRKVCIKRAKDRIVRQDVCWDADDVGRSMVFQPSIVAVQKINHELSAADKVDDIWIGKRICITEGVILANSPYLVAGTMKQRILRVSEDGRKEVPNGCFLLSPVTDNGFYFDMRCHPKLFRATKYPGNADKHIRSIYNGALVQAFQYLQQNDKDGDLDGYENLQALRSFLNDRECSDWRDNDSLEWPNRAAAELIIHDVDSGIIADEE